MAYCNADHFEQIGNMQTQIHERTGTHAGLERGSGVELICRRPKLSNSVRTETDLGERRRHELEEQLFAYLRSEERQTKMKCAKMLCYYKELHERERQAKMRNLELLGNVESLAGKLKEFSIDCSRLLQKRLEYKNHITKLKKDGKKMESRGESEAYESAVIFTGHSGSSGKEGIITTHLLARTELVPNHPTLSPHQSALSMYGHVSNARLPAVLSDDILKSGVCLEGARVSDVHDQQMESDSDFSQRKGEPRRQEDLDSAWKEAEVSSRSVTLKRPAAVVSLERCPTHSPSPDTTDPRDSPQYRSSRGEDEALSAEEHSGSMLGNQDLPDHSQSRRPSIPSPAVESRTEPSAHKHSDILVLTNHTPRRDDKSRKHIQEEPVTHQSGRPDALEPPNRICTGGFCHLLDRVERGLRAKDVNIYQRGTVSEQKLRDIISICRQRCSLDDVDLQMCGAVIVHQLPLLCCNLPQRCLLPADLIDTHWSSTTNQEQIRSCLSAEGAWLWEQCFRHMLYLQNHNVLSTDLVVQIFTPLLVLNNATYTVKAGELLKRLLTYECDTHQPSESERPSSCSLSSLLDDSMEIKPARPSKRHSPLAGTREIQSAEEDSADQSPVESIPIRETNAYQLLKQTVAQERRCSDAENEDSESSDITKSERAEALRDSTTQNSRRNVKNKVNAFSAIQSKAFWGESDDSEIEMALRPKSRNEDANDSDDFYD
ncbi:centrosomal protein kizuna isoform X2 [Triplophysa dalaica]|uniref:centrosomal protein kizuna isoform X2 n=1 Tax=Triplophysa dalaica TaxID=1582913 RepID=UPI0024DF4A15|nr:centrosomal protein kizuna isoform X2 [Triplophysa dalaica]